ncbi:cellulase family glycosylhydrolase [Puniceicoccales bacterium CK1056]|uniref:Cellulase family glycosylhydrolase n=1 Tax=Oceanipulchritudo coccoides TaxID=2706888 RepID=A0A6B2M2N1_9BACT|nr:cellulase family glycosylhydrolase [Oceanipulchritudo coccoides]NDV63208.1 cellulase family glycosylhydrolase [Oceanipulchritudo coccoides]
MKIHYTISLASLFFAVSLSAQDTVVLHNWQFNDPASTPVFDGALNTGQEAGADSEDWLGTSTDGAGNWHVTGTTGNKFGGYWLQSTQLPYQADQVIVEWAYSSWDWGSATLSPNIGFGLLTPVSGENGSATILRNGTSLRVRDSISTDVINFQSNTIDSSAIPSPRVPLDQSTGLEIPGAPALAAGDSLKFRYTVDFSGTTATYTIDYGINSGAYFTIFTGTWPWGQVDAVRIQAANAEVSNSIKVDYLKASAVSAPSTGGSGSTDFSASIQRRALGINQFLITWPSRTGMTYSVQSSSDLSGFGDQSTGLQATPPLNEWWVDFDPSGGPWFYRVGQIEPPATGARAAAQALNKRLFRGNNFMASKSMNDQGAEEDYALLNASHFNHCRIGYKMDEVAGPAPGHLIPASEMNVLQKMVDWCLDEGLIAIVDPVHNWANNNDPAQEYNDTPEDRLKLQRIWEQVAAHFAGYDLDKVVFEIMNEPHGEDNVATIINIGLTAIRGVAGNEERIVIVSGDGFSTRQALIDALDNDEIPSNDNYLIGTFHYYDPRPFTKQLNEDISWGTPAEFSTTPSDFDEVVAANEAWATRNATDPLPLYLGEFGVNNDADNWNEDRERWLSWIRMQAEARDISWAHWNMYNNSDSSKGMGPWTSSEQNNPSLRTFDAAPLEALVGRYEFEDGSTGGGVVSSDLLPGFTGSGYAAYPETTGLGTWARVDGIYIPTTGSYVVNIHYASAIERTVRLVSSAQTLTNVVFPSTGSNDSWATLQVEINFSGSTSADIGNESLKVVADPDVGPNLDWLHVTAPSP